MYLLLTNVALQASGSALGEASMIHDKSVNKTKIALAVDIDSALVCISPVASQLV